MAGRAGRPAVRPVRRPGEVRDIRGERRPSMVREAPGAHAAPSSAAARLLPRGGRKLLRRGAALMAPIPASHRTAGAISGGVIHLEAALRRRESFARVL